MNEFGNRNNPKIDLGNGPDNNTFDEEKVSTNSDSIEEKCNGNKLYKNLIDIKCEEFSDIKKLLMKKCEIDTAKDNNMKTTDGNLILGIITN